MEEEVFPMTRTRGPILSGRSRKRLPALLLALFCLLSLFSCGNKGAKALESSDLERSAVMTVDGFEVPLELYRYVALNYRADYEASHSPDVWESAEGPALLERLKENTAETVARLYATLSLAKQYGINPDDAYVTDAVDAAMKDVYEDTADGDYEAFDAYLRSHNMTDGVYRFIVRNDILAEELMAKMVENGEIPSDAAALEEAVAGPEFVRIKQILVPADNGKSDAENESRAAELLNRAKNGEDFDELVQKYGGDLFMFNNPDGYYLARGTYHEAFENAAFALAVGEISPVVRTDAGWSILKRYEKEAGYLAEHFEELAEDYMSGLYNIRLEEHAETLRAEPTELLASYTIFNLDTTY